MSSIKEIRQERLTGERALFQCDNLRIYDSIFDDGKSPLKECHDIELTGCIFRWCKGVVLDRVTFSNAAETLWHCTDVTMKDVTARGDYFAMNCENVTVYDSFITGEYLGWNARNLTLVNCTIPSGNVLCG